jgi:APA family basic amino acid/polyamine antiporter
MAELKRDLGLWGAVALVVGTTIGSGIFLVPKDMVNQVGSPEMVFAVWIFGGFLSLFGALTYAELSSMLPEAGGEYVYLNAAYGRFWGFVYGWTQTWVAKAASIATLATGFFLYLANFAPGLEGVFYQVNLPIGPNGGPLEIRYGQLLAIVVILALGGINYLGVRFGGNVQIVLTVVKVVLIAAVIGFGLTFTGGKAPAAPVAAPGGWAGFFGALVAALWAYDGWNNAGMVASEIRNPQRNLPIALIAGVTGIMAIYLAANAAYFHVLTGAEVGASNRVAATMMDRVLGAPGAGLVSVAAMLSIVAALNGSLLSGARIPFAMARSGLFFRGAAKVHPQYYTPSKAIVLLTIWSAAIVLTGRYDDLYTLVIFPSWILYGMTAASVIVLRRKRPELPRPYRVLGYPVVPLLFVLVAIALIYSTLQNKPRESGIGLFLIVTGLPFYFYWKRRGNRD